MALLKGLAALALAVMPSHTLAQRTTDPVARWHPFIAEAAARFGIPDRWIERVMRAESGGLTELGGRPIRSRAGAIGLMQLMPATWDAMRRAQGLGNDPDDPHDNIVAGAAFLRQMHDRFGYPGLFAAYNAGPGRYAAYLAGRAGLPGETIGYLAGVTGTGSSVATSSEAPPRQLLFALRRDLEERTLSPANIAPDKGLFAVRNEAQ